MRVIVEPLTGRRRVGGRIVEGVDAGVDRIAIESAEWPVPRDVGVIGRRPGAAICLHVVLSESELAAVKAAVTEARGIEDVAVSVAPPLQDFERALDDTET